MKGLEKSFPLIYSNTHLRTRETLPLTENIMKRNCRAYSHEDDCFSCSEQLSLSASSAASPSQNQCKKRNYFVYILGLGIIRYFKLRFISGKEYIVYKKLLCSKFCTFLQMLRKFISFPFYNHTVQFVQFPFKGKLIEIILQ